MKALSSLEWSYQMENYFFVIDGRNFSFEIFVHQKTVGTANENKMNGQRGDNQKEMGKAKLLVWDMPQVSATSVNNSYSEENGSQIN